MADISLDWLWRLDMEDEESGQLKKERENILNCLVGVFTSKSEMEKLNGMTNRIVTHLSCDDMVLHCCSLAALFL